MNKIIVAGIGPGSAEDISSAVVQAVRSAEVVIGYKYYFRFIVPYLSPGAITIDTGMREERERACLAFEHAEAGRTVCVISSGDSGIYGMAPLIEEMRSSRGSLTEVVVLPGISAFQKAAALLGAPIGHDFCVISLSDLMTPWQTIERRIRAAVEADFVTAVYNPMSRGRYWQLPRLLELFCAGRAGTTPVGCVRQAGRADESVILTTLAEFKTEDVDMFTVILIGNSCTFSANGRMITPRGYYREAGNESEGIRNIGEDIMIKSFRTIEQELAKKEIPLDRKWALLHCIHTTADFSMEDILYTDPGAVAELYEAIRGGRLSHIVTDVTMVKSGIRKGALERLGIKVHCYLGDPRTSETAIARSITRSQAGIRLAIQEYPDALFVFGNAPTALIELCDLMRKGKAVPQGIVAAPVGFVHVEESKHMVKTFRGIPKIVIEGRKGGSNLAATIVNSILCYDDAEALRPGRDV